MPARIAIDSMGGDHGLAVTIPATLEFLERHDDAVVLLVGDPDAIARRMRAEKIAGDHPRIEIVPASEVVTMEDSIEIALRKKKDSSMRVAVNLIKEGRADACVSAGNTGALMAISRYVLKTLEGIDRPAIATSLPNRTGGATTVLDLGANVDCSAEHLLQFAIMGSALVAAIDGKDKPSVGLLNIGEEVIKGNDTVKEAGELMRAAAERGQLNFYGNVEGDDIFKGCVDVVVCDGFVGNVILKFYESVGHFFVNLVKERTPDVLGRPEIKELFRFLDYSEYGGAPLLGVKGISIICHGSSTPNAVKNAIRVAVQSVEVDLDGHIGAEFAERQEEAPA